MEKRTYAQQVAEDDFSEAISIAVCSKPGRKEVARQAALAASAMRRAYRTEDAERRMQAIYVGVTEENTTWNT